MALLASCQTGEISLTPLDDVTNELTEVAVPPRQITDDVNSNEVDKILDKLFEGKQKSRAGYNISLLKDKTGKDAIICINFENNGGFALISAVKTHQPILAYAEEGNFTNTDDLKFPLNLWFEDAIEGVSTSCELPEDSLRSIRTSWRVFEDSKQKLMSRAYEPEPDHSSFVYLTHEEYMRLSRIMMDHINIWNTAGNRVYAVDDYYLDVTNKGFIQGHIYPPYMDDYWAITLIREYDVETTEENGRHFTTHWSQYNGFNESFEYKSDKPDEHIPVGCGPLAVGQMMYAFKYPSYFNWDAFTQGAYGNKITSDYLLDIFNKCNAYYTPPDPNKEGDNGGTSCYTDDMVRALKEYGYNCKKISGNSLNASAFYYGCPAIVGSVFNYSEPNKVGHAWIIENGRKTETYTKFEIWTFINETEFKCIYDEKLNDVWSHHFYVNWGWNNSNDGYYNYDYFVPKYSNKYQSNRLNDAIINITPNR